MSMIKIFQNFQVFRATRCLLQNSTNLHTNLQCLNISTLRKVERLVDIPPSPKQPAPPYLRFVKEHYKECQIQNPSFTGKDIIRTLAKKWSTTDPQTKQSLTEEYLKEKQEHIKQSLIYKYSLTAEQQKAIAKTKQELYEKREKRLLKKAMRLNGKPRAPIRMFSRFIRDQFNVKAYGEGTHFEYFTKHLKTAQAGWKNLPPEEKARYREEFTKAYKEYEEQLLRWEQEMMEKGFLYLIRKETLMEPKPVKTFVGKAGIGKKEQIKNDFS